MAEGEPPLPPGPRRPFFYPVGWGCFFWVVVFAFLYLVIALLWAPFWLPWR